MQPLKLGGVATSGSASTCSPNRKRSTFCGSMLTPSEVACLRKDKARSKEIFTELADKARSPR